MPKIYKINKKLKWATGERTGGVSDIKEAKTPHFSKIDRNTVTIHLYLFNREKAYQNLGLFDLKAINFNITMKTFIIS